MDAKAGGKTPKGKISAVSVADAVATIILRNYVVYESVKLKIVNYHSLAKKLSPEVEEMTGKKANNETIVVAIKRFSDGLSEARIDGMPPILKDVKLNMAGGLVDMTIVGERTPTPQILQDVLKLVSKFTGTPNVFQLPSSVKVIADEEDAQLLDRAISGKYSSSLRKNVAKITIRMPPAKEEVPGMASFITELLYRNGVSVLDAFLSYEDVVLIVQDKFGPKTYQVLSEEISK